MIYTVCWGQFRPSKIIGGFFVSFRYAMFKVKTTDKNLDTQITDPELFTE